MNLELSEEQEAVRQLAKDFVAREITPHVVEWDRAENVDRSIVKKLGSLGFLGLTVPEEYGGSGGDHLAYCLVTEELGRGDSSVRGIVSVSLGLVAKTVATWGDEEQKRQWLPRLTAGEAIGCFGLTEPGTGSDAGNLTTKAVRDGDSYVISGTKMFITNGTWADVVLLFARTGDTPGHKGISAFLVPTDTPGLTRRTIHGKLGLRGQATAEVVLEDVRVPATTLLGPEGKGFSIAMSALAKGRMSVAAGCVGIAQAALDAAVGYAGEREQFGKSIASYQLVQELISDIAVDVDAARLLTWRVADLIDRGEDFATAASKAKLFASEAAVRAANNALQVFGGYGYIDEYPVGKLLRDARVMTLYEGTSQIQKLIIGRALTGVSAF
ncbi:MULTISPECIES: acyl-CoA dehydrogenase family protein [Streptomyces]|jgi:alkylation response protein AidB-like acyl-CoA dehydrogenase|uniref:acyl-CoA dehydrogenase family protein n=1 Tax=unclassified Streptomyces TaxID=2593676 RepID=UPI0008815363|nr:MULTISPECIES: acyl-CoA dehydrogenase family protein [unclassified Streptomyces]MDX2730729.1 acyl-CoA dehydrogenase family protein [Streptomyces sp. PA03-2a]MDX3765332.1 acyl-CoA dehydrogenase family protein [Streptomyces sp. AK08-01B]MDX3814911.1 acyl-CoA dehydrogenase family protein [Streptomyces sp. AK08-01A]WSQ30450.1 acyl-CoA dehydrogenase family protein [Streptomyces sp. NBC_01230]SCY92953.1 Acyl-CoA dehydrogenase [Streptomyces sp. 136MFCol5.1]